MLQHYRQRQEGVEIQNCSEYALKAAALPMLVHMDILELIAADMWPPREQH